MTSPTTTTDSSDDVHSKTTTTSTTLSVFAEHETAYQKIKLLLQEDGTTTAMSEVDQALADLRCIFDKYLELPSLLDKHVETMVGQLTTAARDIMEDLTVFHSSETFWASPLPRQFSALYALSKVRGRKRIQKHLPHRVEDIHVVLRTLRAVDQLHLSPSAVAEESSMETMEHPQLWESLYILWNWMGMLSLVPFRSSIVIEREGIDALVEMAKSYLKEAGPTREMAAACLASWLARPDLETTHLEAFRDWADRILNEHCEHGRDVMRVMGILQTLVTILKVSTSSREILLRLITPLGDTMRRIADTKSNNLLMRKFLIKWWTRTATLYMPPRIAAWRYQRGRRSLKENLIQSISRSSDQKDNQPEPTRLKSIEDYELWGVPDPVEDAMGEVMYGLTDSSTVVRWSAAKGVGRVTERLPAICSDDVLDAVLDLFADRERDSNWQGACLALAELARRGLLLPHRLEEVATKIAEAIHYDVPRRQISVGAHVRDAACYTYWAIARAYAPDILRPFVPMLGEAVVTSFLFDREVNCRRAANAAFQEFVGRQGASNFKNGINILIRADFFSLGNRGDAYLVIAPEIARYDEYRKVIIDHIYQIKLQHWDLGIRLLSSRALGKLAEIDVERISTEVVPYLLRNSLDDKNVQLRHGSIAGLAEIVSTIGVMKEASGGSFDGLLSLDTLGAVVELVPLIEKKRLYRGKGGEQIRASVCRLIECIAVAKVPLTVTQQVRLLDSIDACIPHPNEEIQGQATLALSRLMASYFPVGPNGPSDRLQKRVIDKYVQQIQTSLNPAATRGFSMALGRLPAKLLAPSSKNLDLVIDVLCRISSPDAMIGTDKDAESRRNALVALTRIFRTVGESHVEAGSALVSLTAQQVDRILTALLQGLGDYNMERRGDVGSMSRIAAMRGLVSVASTSSLLQDLEASSIINADIYERMVGGLLKQLAEKLDAVRSEAARCLVQLLTQTEPIISQLPEKAGLLRCLEIKDSDRSEADNRNWADAALTFPLVIKCLDIERYFSYVLSGLVISVGCQTQSVAKEAGAALIAWTKKASPEKIQQLGEGVLELFVKHLKDGRVLLPLLKTLTLLMNRLCIDGLVNDSSFSNHLLMYLKKEESTCTDVHRLSAIIDVNMGLLGAENDYQKEIMSFACKLLMHPYPRIRRLTAEQFYVKLVEQAGMDDGHPVLELLLNNPWDRDYSEAEVASFALQVASSLDVGHLLPPPTH